MPSQLFTPITLRGLSVANRVTVAPMCQYSAVEGVPQDWHLVHLGQMAMGGAGLIFTEATGVVPEGRITPGCTGIYSDDCEAAFARIVGFMKSVGISKVGMQLGHAGRKASTLSPWEGAGPVEGAGAWQTVGPSAVSYLDSWPAPREMDAGEMADLRDAFVAAAQRAVRAGFEAIELHAAHGYLLHQFLSPISNRRGDGYGGSLDNRMRYPLEIFEAVRAALPQDMPLLVRISASDWIEGGWDADQSVVFCAALKASGCDMVDVSSGGLDRRQQIPTGPGYQLRFAGKIRREAGIPTMAVGQITAPEQAESVIASGQADMVALARGMLWDPRWTWRAAVALGGDVVMPPQYLRANPAMSASPFLTPKG